jgi:anti-sigma regulatory factor (Ser/Thr protein kinase)
MQAMLRMAFRLGADLDKAFAQVNDRLADTLAEDRFITAFIGLLDPTAHRLRFHSGGQAPILVYRAATRTFDRYKPTSFPLGAMRLTALRPPVTLDLLPGDILVLASDGVYEQENARGEAFGEALVRDVVLANAAKPMAELQAALLARVRSFAGEAAQEDDMTAVLVKRMPAAMVERAFTRTFDEITPLAMFTAETFDRLGVDPALLPTVDLAVEELFTNMVKYGGGSDAAVRVGLAAIDGGVELTLVDRDVEAFDVTRAPDVDIGQPIDEREPGGLGLHLIRRMVDSVEYRYAKDTRESLITLRITSAGVAGRRAAAKGGTQNAFD